MRQVDAINDILSSTSKNKTVVISLSQYFNDYFVNGNGPINITATAQHKSSNVQTI